MDCYKDKTGCDSWQFYPFSLLVTWLLRCVEPTYYSQQPHCTSLTSAYSLLHNSLPRLRGETWVGKVKG